jgi:hypothetical protein
LRCDANFDVWWVWCGVIVVRRWCMAQACVSVAYHTMWLPLVRRSLELVPLLLRLCLTFAFLSHVLLCVHTAELFLCTAAKHGHKNWSHCSACEALFYDGPGAIDKSNCAANNSGAGPHVRSGSGVSYQVGTEAPAPATEAKAAAPTPKGAAPTPKATALCNSSSKQDAWRLCHKCGGLFSFLFHSGSKPGATGAGLCPGGGLHDSTGSPKLSLSVVAHDECKTEGGWKACDRCEALVHGTGVCVGGAPHELAGSRTIPHSLACLK